MRGGFTMNVFNSAFGTASFSAFGRAMCSTTVTACSSPLSKPSHSESSESLASASLVAAGGLAI